MYKKIISLTAAVVIMIASFTIGHCEDNIKVLLNNNEIAFDVPPQIISNRTMVPMRAIFEAMGATVSWDDSTKTVRADKENSEIMMTAGQNIMFVNLSPVSLDAPPQIIDGRTLVPVRAIAESFDCDVKWDGESKTVIITSKTEDKTNEEKTEEENQFPIVFDTASEMNSSLAKNFVITGYTEKDDKYEITFTVDTYRESSGDVFVNYDCLDSDGKRVDTIKQMFFAYAYCWTPQKSSAVISNKTKTIVLNEN